MGAVGLLCMTASISDGMLFCPPALKRPITPPDMGPSTCFLGAGSLGREIGIDLLKRGGQNEIADRSYSKKQMDILFFHPVDMDLNRYIKNRDIIFLVGSVEDQDFWLARDLALSNEPFLLMTMVWAPRLEGIMETPSIPAKNECLINLPTYGFRQTAFHIIRDIYRSLAFTGLIGIDFADLELTASKRRGTGLFFESNFSNHMAKFERFLRQNMKRLMISKCAYIVFSYDRQIEVEMDNIDKMTGNLRTVMRDSADIFWSLYYCRDMFVEFRTMALLTL